MLTNFMDPVIEAQDRLEQAVSRLEKAIAQRGVTGGSPNNDNAKLAAISAELEQVRAENAELQAVKLAATERLDVAIRQVKGLIGS